jgi:hypothetical protein
MQGNLMGVMAVLKGTPTTYNKDFQECWDLMFDAVRGGGLGAAGRRCCLTAPAVNLGLLETTLTKPTS